MYGSADKPRLRWVPEDERHALEVCLMDPHIGKLAWAEETGDNYDARIAVDRVRGALDDLLAQSKAYPLERIILPLGNDFLHYDTLGGQTTAGTPQDRDSRYQLMFRRGRALGAALIRASAEIAPVSVVVVPGNHDEVSMFHLGEVWQAEFSSDPRVAVDNRARLRKYIRYGVNLIGYTHGKNEPHKKLPQIMAVEEPALWAETRYREFHVGHFHTSKVTDPVAVESYNGVRVRILPSLSGTDAWHAGMGYVGEVPEAQAFVWSRTRGLRANLFSVAFRDADSA